MKGDRPMKTIRDKLPGGKEAQLIQGEHSTITDGTEEIINFTAYNRNKRHEEKHNDYKMTN